MAQDISSIDNYPRPSILLRYKPLKISTGIYPFLWQTILCPSLMKCNLHKNLFPNCCHCASHNSSSTELAEHSQHMKVCSQNFWVINQIKWVKFNNCCSNVTGSAHNILYFTIFVQNILSRMHDQRRLDYFTFIFKHQRVTNKHLHQ